MEIWPGKSSAVQNGAFQQTESTSKTRPEKREFWIQLPLRLSNDFTGQIHYLKGQLEARCPVHCQTTANVVEEVQGRNKYLPATI